MKELIIKFQPFVFKQTIFIKEGRKITETRVPQKDLAKYIADCREIDSVHFFGNKSFARKIKEECMCKYNLTPNKVKFFFNN